jgi:hypothetical protein
MASITNIRFGPAAGAYILHRTPARWHIVSGEWAAFARLEIFK